MAGPDDDRGPAGDPPIRSGAYQHRDRGHPSYPLDGGDDRLHLHVWPVPALDTKVDLDLAQDSYLVAVATVTLGLLTALCVVRLLLALLDLAFTVGVSGMSVTYASGVIFGLAHIWFSLGLTGLECYVGNIGVEARDGPKFFLSFLTWLPILLFGDIVLSSIAFDAVGDDGGGGAWATFQLIARIAVLSALAMAFIGAILLKLAMNAALERIATGQGV